MEGAVDFGAFVIGGVSVIALVIGWVEAAKRLGVTGTWSEVLALALGFLLVGLASAIEQGVIPAEAVRYIEVVVVGLGGALAATGIYDLVGRLRDGGEGG